MVGCATATPTIKSVVGEYEWMNQIGLTIKLVFLENGVSESYVNLKNARDYPKIITDTLTLGKVEAETKWKIVDGKIHEVSKDGSISVYRINKDGSLTIIASVAEGKRKDILKKLQFTFKNIK